MTDSLPYRRKEVIGDAVLYLGDCREILPTLGKVDAVVTDPPYGIRADENPVRGSKKHERKGWDRERPQREVFDAILACSKQQIVWGGNYFTDFLPPSMRWLMWDKGQREFSLADFEMAWTSQQKASRAFDYPRALALKDGKCHPTQKPLALMEWCLGFLPDAKTILDPFMGSGTTLVACAKLGRRGVGIEIDPDYFEIACERIRKAYAQPDFFVAPPAEKPKQEAFEL